MSMEIRQLETLPAIIYNLWLFFQSGCRVNQQFYCPVAKKEVEARAMFARLGNAIFIRPDCLPFDPDIKSVSVNFGQSVNRGKISVETTIIDWVKLADQMKLQAHKYREIEVHGKGFFWNGDKLLSTRSQHHFRKVTSPRTLIQSVADLSELELKQFMMIADLVYGFCCFIEQHRPEVKSKDGGTDDSGSSGSMKLATSMKQVMAQEQRQKMVQLLGSEQQPLMIQTQWMLARMIESRRILRMSKEELVDHVQRELGENPILE